MKKSAWGLRSATTGIKPEKYRKSVNQAGAKYERECFGKLKKNKWFSENQKKFDLEIIKSPWYIWCDKNGKYAGAEPDGLILNHTDKILLIVEIKSWNVAEGVSDINRLYLPLISHLYPDYTINSVVVNQRKGTNFFKSIPELVTMKNDSSQQKHQVNVCKAV